MKEIKFDYDVDSTDEELEAFLDELCELKMAYDKSREGMVEIINPLRMKELVFAEENLKRIFKRQKLEINRSLEYVHDDVAAIEIIGSTVTLDNPAIFMEIIKNADAIGIFAKTNGTVCLEVSYFDVISDVGFKEVE